MIDQIYRIDDIAGLITVLNIARRCGALRARVRQGKSTGIRRLTLVFPPNTLAAWRFMTSPACDAFNTKTPVMAFLIRNNV